MRNVSLKSEIVREKKEMGELVVKREPGGSRSRNVVEGNISGPVAQNRDYNELLSCSNL